MMTQQPQEIMIRVLPTPNPNAWKFVMDVSVLTEGKATYSNPIEAQESPLAVALFKIQGLRQVHFFQNVITITHEADVDADHLREQVATTLQTEMKAHDPNPPKEKSKMDRSQLPADVQKIEEILDRAVRPGLQGDGGDITVLKYEENKIYVHYEGACGTCPSSSQGTLMAIESILRDEFNPTVEIISV